MQLTRQALLPDAGETGPRDPIRYYRWPFVGWLYRERINRGLRLLPQRKYLRALEVGYAAGALQLVLAPCVEELHGIDLDAEPGPVEDKLSARGCSSSLTRGDVIELPYEDGHFDLVVCFSVIEHILDYRRALSEMARVLQTSGTLLLGMPAVNRVMALGFRAIGFRGIEGHHVTTPRDVTAAFDGAGLEVERADFLDLPLRRPLGLRLYHDWLLRKR